MTRHLQVTLTTAGNVYDLMTLILANTQIAAETAADCIFPSQVSELVLQASGGDITFVDQRSNSNTGPVILDGSSFSSAPSSGENSVDLTDYKLKGSANATKVNLTITAT